MKRTTLVTVLLAGLALGVVLIGAPPGRAGGACNALGVGRTGVRGSDHRPAKALRRARHWNQHPLPARALSYSHAGRG